MSSGVITKCSNNRELLITILIYSSFCPAEQYVFMYIKVVHGWDCIPEVQVGESILHVIWKGISAWGSQVKHQALGHPYDDLGVILDKLQLSPRGDNSSGRYSLLHPFSSSPSGSLFQRGGQCQTLRGCWRRWTTFRKDAGIRGAEGDHSSSSAPCLSLDYTLWEDI